MNNSSLVAIIGILVILLIWFLVIRFGRKLIKSILEKKRFEKKMKAAFENPQAILDQLKENKKIVSRSPDGNREEWEYSLEEGKISLKKTETVVPKSVPVETDKKEEIKPEKTKKEKKKGRK